MAPQLACTYTLITDDSIAKWAKDGDPTAVLQAASAAHSGGVASWQRFCFEFASRVCEGAVDPAGAADALGAMNVQSLVDVHGVTAGEYMCDALSGLFTLHEEAHPPAAALVRDVTQSILKREAIAPQTMCEVLDARLIQAVGIPGANVAARKAKKINTDLIYKQKKYNLLSEETEGYAKLVTLLGTLTLADVEEATERMQSLIGFFHLDPNRSLSLVLDALESDSTNPAFFSLLRRFKAAFIPHLLGFKLKGYHPSDGGAMADMSPTPTSVYALAANLVVHGFVTFTDLIPYLRPSIQETAKTSHARHQAMMADARSVGRVNLNASGPSDDDKVEIPTFSPQNQVVGVLSALIDMHAWDHAVEYTNLLEQEGCVGLFTHPPVRRATCKMLHALVDPLYAAASPRTLDIIGSSKTKATGSSHAHSKGATASTPPPPSSASEGGAVRQPIANYERLIAGLQGPLLKLGAGLGSDLFLFIKVNRLLLGLLKGPEASALWERAEIKQGTCLLLETVVLPALSVMDSNPATALELWQVLNVLPYEVRCGLYAGWVGDTSSSRSSSTPASKAKGPEVMKAEATVAHDMKQLLKRISSDKKKLKYDARLIGKISHSNPLVVFDRIISNALSYDNQIACLVESMSYMTPLALDCASFMIVRHLQKEMGSATGSAGKMSAKFEGAVAEWFRNLSTFIGQFYRTNPTTEIQGLMHYIIGKLNSGSNWELMIVKELLTKVGGCEHFEQLTWEQLNAFGGGDALRREVMHSAQKAPKSSVRRKLQEALLMPQTGLPLIVLIAQQRSVIPFRDDVKELKLVGDALDRCQTALSQLVDFESRQRESYATILPALPRLCQNLHVDPSTALFMARPLMRLASGFEQSASSSKSSSGSQGVASTRGFLAQWNVKSDAFVAQVRAVLPPETWHCMSEQLYSLFWCMHLVDIHSPKALYDKKVLELKRQHDRSLRDRDDRKKEQAEHQRLKALKAEAEADAKRVAGNMGTIKAVKAQFFEQLPRVQEALKAETKNPSWIGDVNSAFTQHCVLPRLLQSEEDALYCAHFVLMMHSIEVPHFRSLNYFNDLTRTILPAVFCTTEREAGNLGVFLRVLWEPLVAWAKSPRDFEREARRHGFSGAGKANAHGKYKAVFFNMSEKTTGILMHCLTSNERFEQLAGLCVLRKLIDFFPVYTESYKKVLARLVELAKKEGDGPPTDINSIALSLRGALEKRNKDMIKTPKVEAKKSKSSSSSTTAAATGAKHTASSNGKTATDGAKSSTSASGPSSRSTSGSTMQVDAGEDVKTEEEATRASSKSGSGSSKGGRRGGPGDDSGRPEKRKRDERASSDRDRDRDEKSNGEGGDKSRDDRKASSKADDSRSRSRDSRETTEPPAKAQGSSNDGSKRSDRDRDRRDRDRRDRMARGGRDQDRDRDEPAPSKSDRGGVGGGGIDDETFRPRSAKRTTSAASSTSSRQGQGDDGGNNAEASGYQKRGRGFDSGPSTSDQRKRGRADDRTMDRSDDMRGPRVESKRPRAGGPRDGPGMGGGPDRMGGKPRGIGSGRPHRGGDRLPPRR